MWHGLYLEKSVPWLCHLLAQMGIAWSACWSKMLTTPSGRNRTGRVHKPHLRPLLQWPKGEPLTLPPIQVHSTSSYTPRGTKCLYMDLEGNVCPNHSMWHWIWDLWQDRGYRLYALSPTMRLILVIWCWMPKHVAFSVCILSVDVTLPQSTITSW